MSLIISVLHFKSWLLVLVAAAVAERSRNILFLSWTILIGNLLDYSQQLLPICIDGHFTVP